MFETQFGRLVILVLVSAIMLLAGLYLLANFNRLFRRAIRNRFLRANLAVWLIALCLTFSITPASQDFYNNFSAKRILHYYAIQLTAVTIMAFIVFNITWFISERGWLKRKSFATRMLIILLTIVGTTMLIGVPINFFGNGGNFRNVEITVLFNFWTGCITGLVYVTLQYINLEKLRQMNEKELELSRLRELKTKAELDALHSKINPHFLYNALNSIADLSVTDGKRARRMTVALADLFRYSINYHDHNFSTVREELDMADVYLQIEKIRFEDKLNYTIHSDPELHHYLVPRFVLQPLVENAVKHGLKATGQMTEIRVEVTGGAGTLHLIVADNGPKFPEDLSPGYGVKSMYDKLDLLFPGSYEIHFRNEPRKEVAITISKLMKDEHRV